jgi:NAD(P)-dependent dehydrogenase (short-subunit alcohol dehydrogenase family)
VISIDMSGKTVLITGGTKGIGLASALYFGRAGAKTILTYKWGSADMDELRKQFADAGAPEPLLVQADVSHDDDTDALLEEISKVADGVDVFISNVGYAATMKNLDQYKNGASIRPWITPPGR